MKSKPINVLGNFEQVVITAILSVGESRDSALEQADAAASLVRFDTVPVEAPLPA